MTRKKINQQVWLLNKLTERCARNPSYSLRSFAKTLDISPALLSLLMNGKRPLTRKTALKFSKKLALSQIECDELLSVIDNSKQTLKGSKVEKYLNIDEFHLIADWYHYAILCLADIIDQQADPGWISQRLGITKAEARLGLERLTRLNLIDIKNNKILRKQRVVSSPRDVPSSAIRKHHYQNLRQAEEALETLTVDQRYFGSSTFCFDEQDLEKVKDAFRKFQDEISCIANKGKNKRRIFTMAMQMFPIDKSPPEESKA